MAYNDKNKTVILNLCQEILQRFVSENIKLWCKAHKKL